MGFPNFQTGTKALLHPGPRVASKAKKKKVLQPYRDVAWAVAAVARDQGEDKQKKKKGREGPSKFSRSETPCVGSTRGPNLLILLCM